jgi:cytochrome oxidase Cu insertion factor (SCO1/SenC/PrrC family)
LLAAFCVHAEERRADAARLMNELMSGKAPVGGPFALPDAFGQQRSVAEFRGKLVLLYFGYAQCPDLCPTDLVAIASALNALGAKAADVQPLFVTLDPERDTPKVLREYAAAFHPSFVALRGNEAETRRIARSFKLFYEKVPDGKGGYAIDHAALTFLLDRQGQYVAFFPPGTKPERMATMLKESL